jgi:Family of unknown function (DUF6988)
MSISLSIQRSESLIQRLDKALDGIDLEASDHVRVACACLDLAMEHQKAIVLLVARGLFGSAFALTRIIFESYVRGVWLHRCAKAPELQRFKRGDVDHFKELLRRVEAEEAFKDGVLSAAKQKSWKAMNDFTHSGYLHATRRNMEATIEPNYSEAEILEVLGFANAIGILSAIEAAEVARNDTLANDILEKAKTFLSAHP